jgi:hypothetical protein
MPPSSSSPPRLQLFIAAAGALVTGAALLTAAYYLRRRSTTTKPSTLPPVVASSSDILTQLPLTSEHQSPFSSDFTLALAFVRTAGGTTLSVSTRLALYGAFKVSEFSRAGRAASPSFPRPSPLLDAAGCAKWDSWKDAAAAATAGVKLSGTLSADTLLLATFAEERYVSLLDEASSSWRSAKREKAGSGGVGGAEADEKSMAIGAALASIPLIQALSDGDIAALRIDIHAASRDGRASDVKALLASAFLAGGALARTSLACAITENGETPLHCAADAGSAESVRELINGGAEVGARDPAGQQTPLHYAAAQGRVYAIEALLDAGADVLVRDIDGETPLSLWLLADDVADEERDRISQRLRH